MNEKDKIWYGRNQSADFSEYPKLLCEWYEEKTGKMLNLEKPETFNEKIQWCKLYDHNPLKTLLSDKYKVREWVQEQIGNKYLNRLLGVWDDVESINWEELPKQFVLKATHGSGWNIIVNDKEKLNIELCKKEMCRWLEKNWAYMAGLELQYKDIIPRIIAEEYIENVPGDLYDYKIFCFHGRAKFIWFVKGRNNLVESAIYDLNWHRLNITYKFPMCKKAISRPGHLNEMIQLAERLAADFAHVRVDFYVLNNGTIRFGEMTFSSTSGTCEWKPDKYNRFLGNCI